MIPILRHPPQLQDLEVVGLRSEDVGRSAEALSQALCRRAGLSLEKPQVGGEAGLWTDT